MFRHRPLSLAAALLAAHAALPAATPAEPWLDTPLTSDPGTALAAAAALRVPGDPPVQILLDEARYVFATDGRRTVTRRLVVRLLKEEAFEEYGSVEAVWKPWKDEAPRLRARVVRRDGSVLVLDPATVADRPAQSESDVFDDRQVRGAPLPGLEEGALVEWETVESEKRPFPGGSWDVFHVGGYASVRRSRLVVEAPDALPLKWKVIGTPALSPSEERTASGVRRVFEAVDTPSGEDWEWGTPPDVVQGVRVELTTGTAWSDVGALYTAIVEEKMAGVDLKEEARGRDLAALLAFVRKQVRYASIAFGDSAIVPQPPRSVLGRRYGDCKDQATLLVALLRARGVAASVALLRAGTGPDVDPDLPALASFNHAIVRVESDPPVWIDPTSPFHRAGELPLPDEGRLALVCRKGRSALERIPASPALANVDEKRVEVRLAPFGAGSVHAVDSPAGRFEAGFRSRYDGVSEAARRKSFEEAAKEIYVGAKLLSFDVPPTRDLSRPFRVTTEMKECGAAVTDDEKAVFALAREAVLSGLPSAGEKTRRLDLAVRPFTERLVYRVVPPPGYVVETAPEDETRELGPATYESRATREADGSVVLTLTVSLDRTRITPAEAKALHEAREALEDELGLGVVFESRVEAAAQKGEYRQAFGELASAIAAAPRDAQLRRRRARLLLKAGAGAAALADAEEATRLDPKSARAWHQLGLALQHDAFGRLRKGTWSLKRADEALSRAVELDPEDVEIVADRAILFEFDAAGSRYRDRERLARAIDGYRAALEKRKGNELLTRNLLFALLAAERYRDVVDVLKDDASAQTFGEPLVAAIALSEGAPRAIAEARRRFPEAARRRQVLETVSVDVLQRRRYELAAPLLREAAVGSPNAAALAARADVVAKVRRREPPSEPTDPKSLFLSFYDMLADDSRTVGERLVKIWSASVRKDLGPDEMARMWKGVRRTIAGKGLPLDVAVDLAVSLVELRVEGDVATGFKVRADMVAPGAAPQTFVLWVDIEEGRPVVVGVEGFPESFALHARALVRRGDPEGARRWLERVAETYRRRGGGGSAEPLEGPLFPLVWPSGGTTDPAALEVACAALLSAERVDDATAAVVEAAAKVEPWNRAAAALWLRVLGQRTRFADALEVARRGRSVEPQKLFWQRAVATTLDRLGRGEEADAELAAWTAAHPTDVPARRARADLLARHGKLDLAISLYDEVLKSADALPGDGNQASWFRLAAGRADDEAISLARKAVEWTNRSWAVLNTLGALLAETGKGPDAFGLVIEAMETAGQDEPLPADWFVVGRVFEGYGLVEEARAAYSNVTAAKEASRTDATAVFTLAGRRLAGLPAPAKKAPQRRS